MAFSADVTGHKVIMDAGESGGGKDLGARPKPLVLAALTGCSGMDIVSILKKMKIENYEFEMKVDAETAEEHPMVYTDIVFGFYFKGENLPSDKILRAVELSTQKYCAVNAMLSETAKIDVQVFINGNEVAL